MCSKTLPILYDFWASWCGPCKVIAPYVETLAKTFEGQLVLQKVNVDEDPDLAIRFEVRSVPTLVLVDGEKELVRTVGGMPLAVLELKIKTALEELLDKAPEPT